MIHHRFHHWLVGAVLVSVTVLNVTRPALAQASSRAPKVIYFSRPETADAPNSDEVREVVAQPQQSSDSREALPSSRVPAMGGTEIANDSPPPHSRPVVIRFGQSTRNNTRQATGAFGSVDARPILPRLVDAPSADSRPTIGDGPSLVPEPATNLRVVDAASPGAIHGDRANASRLKTNASAIAIESATANLTDSDVPQLLTEVTSVNATSPTAWKPTATSRRTPPSAAPRVVEFATTNPVSAGDAGITPSANDVDTGLTAAESKLFLTLVSRLKSEATGGSSESHHAQFLRPVTQHVSPDVAERSPSTVTLPLAPNYQQWNDHVMVALIGGFVLLMCVLFCMLIFMLTMVGRRREPMVKVDITNNGTGMAGGMPAYSQAVTMNDSQTVDHTDSQHRTPAHSQPVAPAYSHPVTHQYSQPNPYGDSRFGMPASSQPTVPTYSQPAAPVYTRPTVQAYKPPDQAFTPSAAPANSYPATQPTLRTAPVQATNRQRDEVLQQNQQDGAVARQVFEQNLELREKLGSSQKRVA